MEKITQLKKISKSHFMNIVRNDETGPLRNRFRPSNFNNNFYREQGTSIELCFRKMYGKGKTITKNILNYLNYLLISKLLIP